MYVQSINTV